MDASYLDGEEMFDRLSKGILYFVFVVDFKRFREVDRTDGSGILEREQGNGGRAVNLSFKQRL